MLGFVGTLRLRRLEGALALGLSVIVGLLIVSAPAAHASGCTDSWTNSKGGSWFEGSNWSKGAPPSASDEACITESGTYTVTMTQTSGTVSVESLTVGGPSNSGQTLSIAGSCSQDATVSTSGSFTNFGTINLTNGDSCKSTVRLNLAGGTLTNHGTLAVLFPRVSESREIRGNVINDGVVSVGASPKLPGGFGEEPKGLDMVEGGYTQSSTGTLKESIAGPSNYGSISTTHGVTIEGGTLAVSKVGTPPFPTLETFAVLSGSSLTGTFAKETGLQLSNPEAKETIYLKPTYSSTEATLVVSQATLVLSANSGLPGSKVTIGGSGYLPGEKISPWFVDQNKVRTVYRTVTANSSGEFSDEITIPAGAVVGTGQIDVGGAQTGMTIRKAFSVT